jgi:hypothetical protein
MGQTTPPTDSARDIGDRWEGIAAHDVSRRETMQVSLTGSLRAAFVRGGTVRLRAVVAFRNRSRDVFAVLDRGSTIIEYSVRPAPTARSPGLPN